MSALRVVMPSRNTVPRAGAAFTRLRGRPAGIRRPVLVTSQEADVEFQEWCETVAVASDRCQVRMDRALPRGTLLRLDIPNMRMQQTRLAEGGCVCQWEFTPRGLNARVAGTAAIYGAARYWVAELQFQPLHDWHTASGAKEAPATN